jgi:hypothetical protein
MVHRQVVDELVGWQEDDPIPVYEQQNIQWTLELSVSFAT